MVGLEEQLYKNNDKQINITESLVDYLVEEGSQFASTDETKLRYTALQKTLNNRDLKDIDKSVASEMEKFRVSNPNLDDETYQLFENAFRLGITELKIKDKEKYNPYKNKGKGNS